MPAPSSLWSYLPVSVLEFLDARPRTLGPENTPPLVQSFGTAVLFADILGYTQLCEELLQAHPDRPEYAAELIADALNRYFGQLVKVIRSQGGDVFKFVGDALIALWPPQQPQLRGGEDALPHVDVSDLEHVACRAVQSALHTQSLFQGTFDIQLKIGIGVGTCRILYVGGVGNRMEYVATGEPLEQAFAAEAAARGGEVILSPQCYALLKDRVICDALPSGGWYSARRCHRPVSIRGIYNRSLTASTHLSESLQRELKAYLPWPVLQEGSDDRWISELRPVTLLFVSLGDHFPIASFQGPLRRQQLQRLNDAIMVVQSTLSRFDGIMNKFLIDDKGSTLLAVFGLPPCAHENDAMRGVLAALNIVQDLDHAAVGLTTGVVYCGVVGHHGRKEYSVIGDVVNASARLMSLAQRRPAWSGRVLCDRATRQACRDLPLVDFGESQRVRLKGKLNRLQVYRPSYNRSRRRVRLRRGSPPRDPPPRHSLTPGSLSYRPRPSFLSTSQGSSTTTIAGASYTFSRNSTSSGSSARRVSSSQSSGPGSPPSLMTPSSLEQSPAFWESSLKTVRVVLGHNAPLHGCHSYVAFDCTLVSQVKDALFLDGPLAGVPSDDWALVLRAEPWEQEVPLEPLDASLRLDCLPMLFADLFVAQYRPTPAPPLPLQLYLRPRAQSQPNWTDEHALQAAPLRLAQAVTALLQTNAGGVLLLQGAAGLGKTHLLAKTLACAPVLVLYAAGSQLDPHEEPLYVWVDVLVQLVDERLAMEQAPPPWAARRRGWLQQQVETARDREALNEILPPELQLDVELDPGDSDSPTVAARLQRCQSVVFTLLEQLCSETATVLAIDSVLDVDDRSWELLLQVAQRLPNLLLMVASRAPCSTTPSFVAHQYEALRSLPQAQTVPLPPLPPHALCALARRRLGGHSHLSLEMQSFLVRWCQGSPRMCLQLLAELKSRQQIFENPHERTAFLVHRPGDPPPIPLGVQHALNPLLDALPLKQQILLKCAAVLVEHRVEPLFCLEPLQSLYPGACSLVQLESHCSKLVRRGVLFLVPNELTQRHGLYFGFVQRFLPQVLLARLTRKQHHDITTKLQRNCVAR